MRNRWTRPFGQYAIASTVNDANASLTSLIASRLAFGGTSEAEELVGLADAALKMGDVSWLEVGAGNGANLAFLLDQLAVDRTIDAIAVEPAAFCPPARPDIRWITGRIEDYTTSRTHDWVNVRHSAYYIRDAVSELQRLTRMLAPGGTVALIHWSQDCVLRRVHQLLVADPGDPPCAGVEDLVKWLREDAQLTVSDPIFYETRLDVALVPADRATRDSLRQLLLRGRPERRGVDPDALSHLLRTMPEPNVRRNGIVFVNRPSAN